MAKCEVRDTDRFMMILTDEECGKIASNMRVAKLDEPSSMTDIVEFGFALLDDFTVCTVPLINEDNDGGLVSAVLHVGYPQGTVYRELTVTEYKFIQDKLAEAMTNACSYVLDQRQRKDSADVMESKG